MAKETKTAKHLDDAKLGKIIKVSTMTEIHKDEKVNHTQVRLISVE